ncbi:GerAB/ArcD/ProY family transporter [Gottfriedia sp. NPDC056225]|uniref:GerAB/ArcD/ProY family transporter n=1 Tax=Gottfriedia sp. NPDC056225 TaxID=3345751 RepID=UPI0035E00DE7
MIKNKHLFFIILFTQFGVTISRLPFSVYKITGSDGWISVLLTGVLIQILLFIYYSLYKSFPEKGFTEYTKILMNTYIGSFINICYFIYFLYICIKLSIEFVDVINIWMFPNTPTWVVLILFILTAIFIAKENIQTIGRTFLSFSFIFFFVILFIMFAYKNAHFGRLLPIGDSGIKKIAFGISPAFVNMLGFEVFLFLGTDFENTKKKLSTISLANLVSTTLFTFVILTCYVSLSHYQSKTVKYPILYIIKGFQLQMVENLHIVLLSFWTIIMALSFIIYLYILSEGILKQFKSKVHNRTLVVVIISLFLVSIYPIFSIPILDKLQFLSISIYFDSIFIILIPCLLFIVNKVRRLIA